VNWAFILLGVSPDADSPSVKRAYARLLRCTRPDEDAEGFQRLHEAYQLVLAHVLGQEARTAASVGAPAKDVASIHHASDRQTPATVDGRDRTTPTDAGSPSRITAPAAAVMFSVNPRELVSRVIDHAVAATDALALSRWLAGQPEFWSIQIKQHSGQLLLQQLFREPQPMAPDCLDALLQFFDLRQVLSGVNAVALGQLRQRQLALWYVLPEHHRALAMRMSVPTNRPFAPARVLWCLRLLESPLRWQKVLWPAMRRHRTSTMALLIQALCAGHLEYLPGQINRQHAEFWYRAAQLGKISWPRFALGSVRAAFLALIVMVGMLSFTTLSSLAEGSPIDWYGALVVAATMAACIFSVWLIYAAWMWLDHWQGQPEAMNSNLTWFRRMLIPALCTICVALDYLSKLPVLATCMMIPTALLAVRRLQRRSPPRPRRRPIKSGNNYPSVGLASLPAGFFLLMLLARVTSDFSYTFFDDVPSLAIGATIILCIWLADMWRYRHFLKRSAAR
jgi:hypothetical protein